jgi:hypothetical protein
MDVAAMVRIETIDIANLPPVVVPAPPATPVRDFTQITGAPRLVFGSEGADAGQFNRPLGIALANDGNLVVGELTGMRLQTVDQQGQHVRFLTSDGQNVYAVAMSLDGNGVWTSHNTPAVHLRDITSGVVVRTINTGGNTVTGVCVCADGAVVVACLSAHQVVCFNPADDSQRWASGGNGDFGNSVFGVTVSGQHVFVVDYEKHCVQVLSLADGTFVRTIGDNTVMAHSSAVAFDSHANVLIVAEHDKVSVWSVDDGVRRHVWGSEGTGPGQFGGGGHAMGVCVGADGTVFVADQRNHRVQIFQILFVLPWHSQNIKCARQKILTL